MSDFRQCTLRKPSCGGHVEIVVYIPIKFASVGDTLRLRNDSGVWSDGWVVHAVHGTLSKSELPDTRPSIKAHRRKTGDSLPRAKDQP